MKVKDRKGRERSCQGGGKRDEDAEHRIFKAVQLFCITAMADTCHYTSVNYRLLMKTHKMYSTQSEPQCKMGAFGDDVSAEVNQL